MLGRNSKPMTDRQVRNLVNDGYIEGEKFGAVWLITLASVVKEQKRRERKSTAKRGKK